MQENTATVKSRRRKSKQNGPRGSLQTAADSSHSGRRSAMPDNYDRFEQYDRRQQYRLSLRPVCVICGEHIQSEYCFQLEGGLICESCIEDSRCETEDFV